MRVVHESDEVVGEADATGEPRTLASNVEVADTSRAHAMGLRFRRSLPEDYAFVMDVGDANPLPLASGPSRNVVDMFFMRVPLDIVWLLDDEVVKTKRMHPWRSFGVARADTIIEFPVGGADGVAVGDTVRVEDVDAPGDATDASDADEDGPAEAAGDADDTGPADRGPE